MNEIAALQDHLSYEYPETFLGKLGILENVYESNLMMQFQEGIKNG